MDEALNFRLVKGPTRGLEATSAVSKPYRECHLFLPSLGVVVVVICLSSLSVSSLTKQIRSRGFW